MSELTISCLQGLLMPCFAAADQGIGLNPQFFVRANVFFVARFTLSQPSTPVRNATNLRTICFRDYLLAFERLLLEPACSLQLDLHWASPQLP